VARVKLFLVETKVFERRGAFGVIPSVAEENSSNIPENGVDFRHLKFSLSSFSF
jgi:hypothetical protein